MISLIGGYMDTRKNKEDFAITPYLSGVWFNGGKIFGIGATWGWWSIHVGIAINLPKEINRFQRGQFKTPN